MSKFIDKYFPTFKKLFAKLSRIPKFKKTRKFFRFLFFILIISAALIIVNNYFGSSSDYDFYDDEWFDEEFSYCEEDNNVWAIPIRGSIYTYIPQAWLDDPSLLGDDVTASEDIVFAIDEAEKDDRIKAILLDIDSFGGQGTAAKEIADALKRAQKPTVVMIKEYGLSAAYWAASGADVIFANNTSNVGSIGVTMSYLDYSKQNKEEGITYQQLSSGKFKDSGDPDKELTAEEKALFQRDVDILHEIFVADVAANRGLTISEVQALADGSSMMGQMALENGLIDRIGDEYAVREYLQEKLGEEVSICW